MKKNWDVRVRLKNANEKIMQMQSLKGLIIIYREGGWCKYWAGNHFLPMA